MKACDWCNQQFKASVSYQIYCSVDCRDEATKEKIAERHKILRIQSRHGKIRLCHGGCGTRLSVYNESTLCTSCSVSIKEVNLKVKEIKRLMNNEDQL